MADLSRIFISDVVPPDTDVQAVVQAMLDDLSREAAGAGWPGLSLVFAGYAANTRVVALAAEEGAAVLTLDDVRAAMAQRRAAA